MYVLLMEDKMAAGASMHVKNYGCFLKQITQKIHVRTFDGR